MCRISTWYHLLAPQHFLRPISWNTMVLDILIKVPFIHDNEKGEKICWANNLKEYYIWPLRRPWGKPRELWGRVSSKRNTQRGKWHNLLTTPSGTMTTHLWIKKKSLRYTRFFSHGEINMFSVWRTAVNPHLNSSTYLLFFLHSTAFQKKIML